MTEIRTTSSTGGQKGVKPETMSLLPRKGLAAIARVFGFGATKYNPHNWRLKYEWSKSLDSLDRHIGSFMDGETYDPESGLPHLAHAGFHILVLLTWLEEDGEGVDNPMDDRWPAALERMRLAEEPEHDYHTIAQEILDRRAAKPKVIFEQGGAIDSGVVAADIVTGLQRSFDRRGYTPPTLTM